jgi:DNA-binding CsgD family transcriptional regulator
MTPQDKAILALLAQGRSVPQVQGDLGLSVHRIRVRLESLRREFGAANVTALVATAIRKGYVSGEDEEWKAG